MSALRTIRQLDYTVLFARRPEEMRRFYEQVLHFPVVRELGPSWVELQVGSNLLVLTRRGLLFDDAPTPDGALSVQLAFRVAPGAVAACAEELRRAEVALLSGPTDQPWGHRTLFFRDPDGNVLEIYAEL